MSHASIETCMYLICDAFQNELIFSLNGECKGIAAYHIPFQVFAVIDLYGQVAQASIMSYVPVESIQTSTISNDLDTCKCNLLVRIIEKITNLPINIYRYS